MCLDLVYLMSLFFIFYCRFRDWKTFCLRSNSGTMKNLVRYFNFLTICRHKTTMAIMHRPFWQQMLTFVDLIIRSFIVMYQYKWYINLLQCLSLDPSNHVVLVLFQEIECLNQKLKFLHKRMQVRHFNLWLVIHCYLFQYDK